MDCAPDQRDMVVAARCADDAVLHDAVLRLIEAAADDEFLGALASEHAATLEVFGADQSGRMVGPYRLRRLLGMGGMGAVYLAERVDGGFDQRVAVKLMRSGPLSTDAVARFRRERQILAFLNHPHIARLLDGGLDQGMPYLIMEHVDGASIDQHCTSQSLDLRAILTLFISVCEAVDHAHRNLVVHRDLKPGNILVTPAGDVKLLDFGVARLLDDGPPDVAVTQAGPAPYTPAYASPEQIRGAPLSTATDIYSLGVILYRLLCGRLPHDVEGLSARELEARIAQAAPRPSTFRRELRGDLDTILHTALQHDPARRYRSVGDLADDLRRHLERRPVRARPDTVLYRLSKFVRRNGVGVGAAVAIVLAVAVGALTTANEGRRAARRFEQVRDLANVLLFDLHDAVRDLPGATAAREMLVSHALDYLDLLSNDAPKDPALRMELATAYEQIGEIQGDPHRTNMGDLAGASSSYGKAFALREAIWRDDTARVDVRHAFANSTGRLAVVTSWSGNNADAITLSRRALDLLRPLRRRQSPPGAVDADYARIASELGWWLIWSGQVNQGLSQVDTAIQVLQAVTAQGATVELKLDLWRAYTYRVDGLRFSSRFREALTLLEDTALPLAEIMNVEYPHHPRVQYALHVGHDFIGGLYDELGDVQRAAPAYRTAYAMAEALVEADPANQKAFEALARSTASLGDMLMRERRVDDAIATYERAIGVLQSMLRKNPRNTDVANMLGNVGRRLCQHLQDASRFDLALRRCLAAETVLESAVAANLDNAVVRANLGSTYVWTARAYRALARSRRDSTAMLLASARDRYRRGLALLRELDGTDATPEITPSTVLTEIGTLRVSR